MILAAFPRRAVALLIALFLLAPPLMARPDRAEALPGLPDVLNPCNIPGVRQGCDAVKAGVDAIAGVPGDIAKAIGNGILGQLTGWVGDGAGWLVRQVVKALDVTTRVDLGGEWFSQHYRWMLALGGFLLLPFLILAILQGLIRQDWTLLVRAAFGFLPAAVLLTALAVAVTQTVLSATDALSGDLADGVARDAGKLGETFSKVFLTPGGGAGVPLFVGFLVGLVMAFGAFLVWVELLVRSAAIYLAVLFLPFCLAAMVWPATARWTRRLVDVLIALVLSKLVIVAALALGLGAIASGEGVGSVLAGAGMFMVAAFVPFALLSLIPLAGEVAHTQRAARGGLAAATGGALAWQAARARLMGMGGTGRLAVAGGSTGVASAMGNVGGAAFRPPRAQTGEGDGGRTGARGGWAAASAAATAPDRPAEETVLDLSSHAQGVVDGDAVQADVPQGTGRPTEPVAAATPPHEAATESRSRMPTSDGPNAAGAAVAGPPDRPAPRPGVRPPAAAPGAQTRPQPAPSPAPLGSPPPAPPTSPASAPAAASDAPSEAAEPAGRATEEDRRG
jgi:hypothetical protein